MEKLNHSAARSLFDESPVFQMARQQLDSVARIIESSPERVVIHWRYLPKFTPGNPPPTKSNLPYFPRTPEPGTQIDFVTNDKFVDEYFTVTPDGRVERTFRAGTPKTEDWTDSQNLASSTLQLSSNGIQPLGEKPPVRSAARVLRRRARASTG